jgi:serine phosphatase RsbU (regulator of sigma subunit)
MTSAMPLEAAPPPRPGNSLSSEIQSILVPPIDYRGAGLEALGNTIPLDDVGGDLADLVAQGKDVIAYVVDVSGHGLRAGVLMGMIKTAVRYGLLLRQPLAKLFDDLNRVLPAVKASNHFATLAALRFYGSNEAEYLSAGHVPLLHYRRRGREVVRYSMPQLPLGIFARAGYVSRRIRYEPGDIFALVTDGVVEADYEREAAFAFERLERALCDLSLHPLDGILARVQAEAVQSGIEDDRTVLLVRALASNEDTAWGPEPQRSNDTGEVREIIERQWRELLEELAAELTGD